MDVDARAVYYGSPEFSTAPDKGPLHLAIVATLASIALLSYLLRAYTHGRLRRRCAITNHIDVGIMFFAALCTVGALISYIGAVKLGLGKLNQETILTSAKSVEMGEWTWALRTCHIVGVGLVRTSAIAYIVVEYGYRPTGFIGMLTYLFPCIVVLSMEWVCALHAQCYFDPLTNFWDPAHKSEEGFCYSAGGTRIWAIINFSLNVTLSVVLITLTLPLLASSSTTLAKKIHNTVAVCFSLLACAAAIFRLKMVIMSWPHIGYRHNYDLEFITWAVIELSAWLLAANMPPLCALFTTMIPSLRESKRPAISAPIADSLVHTAGSTYNPESCNSRHSSQTVIYRPNTSYFPSRMSRFHDEESCITFEMSTTRSTRSPTKSCKTGKSFQEDTRRVSDWSQFSGFTYYTNATSEGSEEDKEDKKENGRVRVSTSELEEIVKSLGIERPVRAEVQGDPEEDGEGDGTEHIPASSEEIGGRRKEGENNDEDGDSVSLQSEADSSEVTVSRLRARS